MSYPVKVPDILKFEHYNQISINVFGYEKGEVIPVRITTERFNNHVNLLLISNGKKSHYCWIKDLNKLLNDQKSNTHRHYFCHYCLHGFTQETLLIDHIPYCQIHGPQKIVLPTEEDISKQLKVTYVIYADFECFAIKMDTCTSNPSHSYAEKLTRHVPSGFAYKLVALNDNLSRDPVVYRGEDVADMFIQHMLKIQDRLDLVYKKPKPLHMTMEERSAFRSAVYCHICHGVLGDDRVRDHCHITGTCRGAAHNECNVNFRLRNRITVIFHNFRGYDAHLIMQVIGKTHKEVKWLMRSKCKKS